MTIKLPKSRMMQAIEDRAAGFISGGAAKHVEISIGQPTNFDGEAKSEKTVVNMRFNRRLLERIDAAAQRKGVTRTAWIHWIAEEALRED
jgi:predicted DNA binding CopG/RHH family protein